MDDKDTLYDFLLQYEATSAIELNKALDALRQLREDDQISDKLAKHITHLLVSRHIHREMTKDLYKVGFREPNKKLKFMNFKYGKTHETYA
jgi:DNA polymerase III delta prime subunit